MSETEMGETTGNDADRVPAKEAHRPAAPASDYPARPPEPDLDGLQPENGQNVTAHEDAGTPEGAAGREGEAERQ